MPTCTDQIVLFGDSITQFSFAPESGAGFGTAVAHAYVRRLDVLNRGFSGYNTRQALSVLDAAVPAPTPTSTIRLMAVFLGANDARLPDSPGGPQQHIPLAEYRANLTAILTHPRVRAHKDIRLVLITPPPIEERVAEVVARSKYPGEAVELNRLAATTARYAAAAAEVGAELGVAVLDLWSAMVERAGRAVEVKDGSLIGSRDAPSSEVLQSYVTDGLHLSPTGYALLYEEFMKLVIAKWPELAPERMAFACPAWDSPAWLE